MSLMARIVAGLRERLSSMEDRVLGVTLSASEAWAEVRNLRRLLRLETAALDMSPDAATYRAAAREAEMRRIAEQMTRIAKSRERRS